MTDYTTHVGHYMGVITMDFTQFIVLFGLGIASFTMSLACFICVVDDCLSKRIYNDNINIKSPLYITLFDFGIGVGLLSLSICVFTLSFYFL